MTRRSRRYRPERSTSAVKQLPWRQVVNPYRPVDVLGEEQVERIHLPSLDVLETSGPHAMRRRFTNPWYRTGAILKPGRRPVACP